MKVLYVLGAARGGTTIVGRVLGQLGGAVFGGELRRLWGPAQRPGRRCGCGQPLPECVVWGQVLVPGSTYWSDDPASIARLQRSVAPRHMWWHAWRMVRSDSPPPHGSASSRYLTTLSDLYTAFALTTGAELVVDTSKKAPDAALLRFGSRISAFCAQVVRDPRGVVYSRRKRTTPGSASRPRPLSTVQTTLHWVVTQLAAEAVRRRYGESRSIMIRYEDFADDPGPVLASVAGLVGVGPPDSIDAGTPIQVGVGHGPDGNGRFSTTAVVVRRDDAWTTELHPVDRAIATLIAYPLLRRYRFPVRIPPAALPPSG